MRKIIVEAIIEDGRLRHVAGDLPAGRIKVHLMHDSEEPLDGNEIGPILAKTSGIYGKMDAEKEARILRKDWERRRI